MVFLLLRSGRRLLGAGRLHGRGLGRSGGRNTTATASGGTEKRNRSEKKGGGEKRGFHDSITLSPYP